ncbi:ATP-dependent helicase [Fictibacillus sp. WQ 8-8]|uniref:UvrD-helicase domain-containing protein n=1 Tax=Fictibacillus sp. WQ 8-8 TaxID=2938788 RepID=UPI00210B48C8|nr:ATP-dependent helicase [Fictibacillus sp. WQ 8-8]MCQ6267894.1 ATP-dependent helicase [Fictibacillus sp. WQ 8-8]
MYNELNTEQKNAVKEDGNVLVIACPGSGKTRVLTLRIAKNLMELESKKQCIVALTYTNRAAEEIHQRIEKLEVDTSQLWTGTIHSFCVNWILKPYAGYIQELKDGFSIIDEFTHEQLLKVIKEEYFLSPFVENITAFKRNGDYKTNDQNIKNAAKEFHTRLLNSKFIDFDLILYFSYRLLLEKPKIARTLSRFMKNFYIDEFQDTQDLQYGIIGEIIKSSGNTSSIFIVGDPDQAIYESLGGQAKTLDEIQQDIGGAKIKELHLSGNYRSSQRIIDLYSYFQMNEIKIIALGKKAKTQGIITYNQTLPKNDLHKEIARLIKKSLDQGIPESEICVVAPRWIFLTDIARKLKGELPTVSFDAPGLTPLPRNPDNFWYKLARLFLTRPSPGLYLTRIRWVKEIINDLNFIGVYSQVDDYDNCRKMLNIINRIKPNETDGIKYLSASFKELFKKINVDITNEKLRLHWETFFSGIIKRSEREDFKHIPTDVNSFKSMFMQSKGVVINTCHGVKGEEYETVISFGLLRGYIPHWNQIINRSYQTEFSASNKMLYVIGSRAKTNLHLISETGRFTINGNSYEPNYQLNSLTFNYDYDLI